MRYPTQIHRPASAAVSADVVVCFDDSEFTRLFSAPLVGGQIIWKADVGAVVLMKKTIQAQIKQMERANRMLAWEWREQSAREGERERRRLLMMLESEIQADVGLLRGMIEAYPDAPNRKSAIGRIALLLCYIKRQCNFFFRRAESRQMQMDELYVYLRALGQYAHYLDSDILIDCPMTLVVDIGQANVFYRFFYSMLIYMCETGKAHALGDWAIEADALRCRIMLDQDVANDRPYSDPPLMAAIRAQGGVWLVRELDEDTVGYQVIFERRAVGSAPQDEAAAERPEAGDA